VAVADEEALHEDCVGLARSNFELSIQYGDRDCCLLTRGQADAQERAPVHGVVEEDLEASNLDVPGILESKREVAGPSGTSGCPQGS